MKLKKFYTSREVAVLTGLSARQLQWWDARRLFSAAVATHRTEAGGFTERRYTAIDVLELQVLADLRRRGFSVPRLRRLLSTLRSVFGVRLYEAIGEGGPLTLFIAGDGLYARTADGRFFDIDRPAQPLLVAGDDLPVRPLVPRERKRRASKTPARAGETRTGRAPRVAGLPASPVPLREASRRDRGKT